VAYIAFDDIPLQMATPVRRTQRRQVANFGDGYSQILTDGLNIDQERWQCQTPPLPYSSAYSIESFFLSTKGQAISWTPLMATKNFQRPFTAGTLNLGYDNIESLTLDGYSRPTDYTANLATGVLTSVTIANDTVVDVTLTLAARNYILADGWTMTPDSSAYMTVSFELVRIYV
jgi:phage-related protein